MVRRSKNIWIIQSVTIDDRGFKYVNFESYRRDEVNAIRDYQTLINSYLERGWGIEYERSETTILYNKARDQKIIIWKTQISD